MAFLGLSPATAVNIEYDAFQDSSQRDAHEQPAAFGPMCIDCNEPLYRPIELAGSRTLILPIAHRCSA